jgi:hypothetical protein
MVRRIPPDRPSAFGIGKGWQLTVGRMLLLMVDGERRALVAASYGKRSESPAPEARFRLPPTLVSAWLLKWNAVGIDQKILIQAGDKFWRLRKQPRAGVTSHLEEAVAVHWETSVPLCEVQMCAAVRECAAVLIWASGDTRASGASTPATYTTQCWSTA